MRRRRRSLPLLVLFSSLVVATADKASFAEGEKPVPKEWLTPAETANFESTPSYDETLDFIRRVEAAPAVAGSVKLDFYGESAAHRPMPLVIVSKEKAFTPEAARALLKPIVLVINGIHGGEVDGKDATLLLLRDLAIGRRAEMLEQATILFLPIYNVDGHERVSPWNRPNQDGPVKGMGFRTTSDGHDLNRDFLKLETPEARNLVRLFNAWQPHLIIDDHVTDGVDLAWVLTLSVPRAPQLAKPIDDWLQAAMPQLILDTEQMGHPTGPYVDLVDRLDPLKGIDSAANEPRFSTGYFPLRNRPAILVETHSHKPYRERVLANRDFLAATFKQTAAGAVQLKAAIASANLNEVASGRRAAASGADPVVVTWERDEPGNALVPFYAWSERASNVSGKGVLGWKRGEVREEAVPWFQRLKPAKILPRPAGYLVEPGWPAIEERIALHGLKFERLSDKLEAEVETARLSGAKVAAASYQGRSAVQADVARAVEKRSLPAGALWIPADQPDFEVAVQLFEPEAPDSLFRWGFLSTLLEGKEYIDPGKLDELATEMLKKPEVRAEWEKALADPGFAADGDARYLWWYRRTPYWDERRDLLPVYRVLKPLSR